MAIQKRLYTVDDVFELLRRPTNADVSYELINGELIEMSPANSLHSWLASEISRHIGNYVSVRGIGFTLVEAGFHLTTERHTFLVPDVAFVSNDRQPTPLAQTFAEYMPDLAVEIVSPSNALAEQHRKTGIYLRHGASLVWIVIPDREGVEVCRLTEDGRIATEFSGVEDHLSGEAVLPGFELPLRQLFPKQKV